MGDQNASGVYTARGRVEGEDWSAVAVAVNERMAARRIGQQELAHLSGVSVSTLRQIQHSAGRRVQNKTLTAISRALDWPENHLTQVLISNSQPQPAERADHTDEVLEAVRRVEQRLAHMSQQIAALSDTVARHVASRPTDGQSRELDR